MADHNVSVYCKDCYREFWAENEEEALRVYHIHKERNLTPNSSFKLSDCEEYINKMKEIKEVFVKVYGDKWKEKWNGEIPSYLDT